MKRNELTRGYIFGAGAYLFWGFTPIYWKLINQIPAFGILLIRVAWLLVCVTAYFIIRHKNDPPDFSGIRTYWRRLVLAGLFLGCNWLIYIFSVNAGFLQDASLGYYINPLVSVFLGMIVLREKLDTLEKLSLVLAVIGVVILSLLLGRIPWISFILAFSFGIYGLIKKKTNLNSMSSLSAEVTALIPILIILWIALPSRFYSIETIEGSSLRLVLLTAIAGPLTLIPLIMFAEGAKRIPLSAVGFLQFLTPTTMLIISVSVFHEEFSQKKLPGFILIWVALAFFLIAQGRKLKKRTGKLETSR